MYPRIELSPWEDGGAGEGGGRGPAALPDVAVDGAFFSSLPHDVTFYIVRHGRTEGNASRTFQGRLDYPLDPKGVEQAGAVASWLAGKSVDALVASPQKRAAATAAIIADACGLAEPLCLPSLMEVDVGSFSGLTMEAARAAYPEVFGEFVYRSWDAVPDAEHSRDMRARAVASWTRMRELAEKGARSIVCVSHGGLIQWLIRTTFGARSWLPLFPLSNCGVSQLNVEVTGEGNPAFMEWATINFIAPRR